MEKSKSINNDTTINYKKLNKSIIVDDIPINEWDSSNIIQKFSFRIANRMINSGCEKPLEYEDLVELPSQMYCGESTDRLIILIYINFKPL
jgi:hypothetical protein